MFVPTRSSVSSATRISSSRAWAHTTLRSGRNTKRSAHLPCKLHVPSLRVRLTMLDSSEQEAIINMSPPPPSEAPSADAEPRRTSSPARSKRPREDPELNVEAGELEERPSTRPRTAAYIPPPGEAPGFLDWLAVPIRSFMAGFRDALRNEAESPRAGGANLDDTASH
jgi:hypothetical protein